MCDINTVIFKEPHESMLNTFTEYLNRLPLLFGYKISTLAFLCEAIFGKTTVLVKSMQSSLWWDWQPGRKHWTPRGPRCWTITKSIILEPAVMYISGITSTLLSTTGFVFVSLWGEGTHIIYISLSFVQTRTSHFFKTQVTAFRCVVTCYFNPQRYAQK